MAVATRRVVREIPRINSGVRNCNIVMLALGSLLGKIGSKGWLPLANELCSIEKSVSQIA